MGLLVEVLGLNNGLLMGSFSLDMSNGFLSPVVDELSMSFSSFQLLLGYFEDLLRLFVSSSSFLEILLNGFVDCLLCRLQILDAFVEHSACSVD